MQQAFAKLPDYDPEIDQYNTLARHYPAKLGRWLSPDWSATPTPVPYAELADPQSLNLYAYVRNNPTSRTDPDGHRCYDIGGCLGYVTNQLFTSFKNMFGIPDTPPAQDQSADPAAQTPASLEVVDVKVLPAGTKGDYGNLPSENYGIFVDIKYQVLDAKGKAINNGEMTPKEQVTFSDGTTKSNDVGPTRISTTSKTTAADGTFHDAPVGHSQSLPMNKSVTLKQTIAIEMGEKLYTVRTQTFTIAAPKGAAGFGHGSIVNDLGDISGSR